MNNKLKSQLETEYLKASYLKDELQKVDKNADSITLNKLKLDLEDSLNKIKTLNSQIKKSNDIGISAPKVGQQYSVQQKPFTPAFSTEVQKMDRLLEITSRRINEMSNGKLKTALEQAYIQSKFLRDTLSQTDKIADATRLTGLSVDIDEAKNKLQEL